MPKIRDVRLWTVVLAIVLVFWPPALLLGRQRAFEIIDAIIAALAVALSVRHLPGLWKSLRKRVYEVDLGQAYVVGLFLIGSAIAIVFGGLWAWRTFNKPDAIADAMFALFSRYMIAWGLFLALAVNWSEDGRLAVNAFWRTVALAMLAATIAAVLAYLSA